MARTAAPETGVFYSTVAQRARRLKVEVEVSSRSRPSAVSKIQACDAACPEGGTRSLRLYSSLGHDQTT